MNLQNKNCLCTAATKGTEKPRRQVKRLVEITLYQKEAQIGMKVIIKKMTGGVSLLL